MNLLFEIKTWLMMQVLKQTRKKRPFDGVACDTFHLPADAGEMINNSYFFGANSAEGESLIMRVGKRNAPLCEIFVIYVTPDGHLYTSVKDHYPIEECPMEVECVVPEKHFRVKFDGNLLDTVTGEEVACQYSLDFHATLPCFSALHHSDFRGMAQAFARPNWNREFFKKSGGDTGAAAKGEHDNDIPQIHYEQAGHFTGTLKLASLNSNPGTIILDRQIDMPGSRDHAFGKRDWNYMSDHIWLMVTTAKGETFNFSLVDYPMVTGVFCGYTNIGYDHDESLVGYKIIQWDACDGKAPDVFIVDCTFTDGKTVRVTAKRENNLYLTFDNGNFFFQEGVGEVDFGGIKCRGSIEYGFNKDKSRWAIGK